LASAGTRITSWQKQLQNICGEEHLLHGEPECGQAVHAHGRCRTHYLRWRTHWRDICPGPCNNRWRAADTGYRNAVLAYDEAMTAWAPGQPEPGKPQPPEFYPWAGAPVMCGRCTATARRELSELSDLAAITEAEFTGQRRGPDSQRVSGTRHSPSPSPTVDDLDELACMLREWEATARSSDTRPRRGYLASEIATVCARLSTACFPALMNNPDLAHEFTRDIHDWHRRLRDATRTGTGKHQKKRPCPRCDRNSLVWEEGNEHVACETSSCGRLMSLDEYEQYDKLFPHFEPRGETPAKNPGPARAAA
jgi:hypothetical protein